MTHASSEICTSHKSIDRLVSDSPLQAMLSIKQYSLSLNSPISWLMPIIRLSTLDNKTCSLGRQLILFFNEFGFIFFAFAAFPSNVTCTVKQPHTRRFGNAKHTRSVTSASPTHFRWSSKKKTRGTAAEPVLKFIHYANRIWNAVEWENEVLRSSKNRNKHIPQKKCFKTLSRLWFSSWLSSWCVELENN